MKFKTSISRQTREGYTSTTVIILYIYYLEEEL